MVLTNTVRRANTWGEAGTGIGLPSPGHTTLTQARSNWAVDSFFDITYRIDFVGKPGGTFAGQSGSTTGTVRFDTQPIPEPSAIVLLIVGGLVMAFRLTRGGWRDNKCLFRRGG